MPDTDPDTTIGIAAASVILGVSRQRADQLSRQTGFPTPFVDGRGVRSWDRAEIEAYHRQRKATTS